MDDHDAGDCSYATYLSQGHWQENWSAWQKKGAASISGMKGLT